jgi:hypothetical protein
LVSLLLLVLIFGLVSSSPPLLNVAFAAGGDMPMGQQPSSPAPSSSPPPPDTQHGVGPSIQQPPEDEGEVGEQQQGPTPPPPEPGVQGVGPGPTIEQPPEDDEATSCFTQSAVDTSNMPLGLQPHCTTEVKKSSDGRGENTYKWTAGATTVEKIDSKTGKVLQRTTFDSADNSILADIKFSHNGGVTKVIGEDDGSKTIAVWDKPEKEGGRQILYMKIDPYGKILFSSVDLPTNNR